jgi:diaminopimelate epimerase
MKIPFTKSHGARNDFLLTWEREAPAGDLAAMARAICDRHTGVGADGWMLVSPLREEGVDAAIRLFNSDGSEPEMSGNGTRCAAAFLIQAGLPAEELRIRTGAGLKHLRLTARSGRMFEFEMNMGRPEFRNEHFALPLAGGPRDVTLLWVGNPQCAVAVAGFDFDWRKIGAEIESHPHFPNRTNVSFVRKIDRHAVEARFYERGAGETMSSGTGSTGAFAAAVRWGWIESPARILTPAGLIHLRWDQDVFLAGPAEIVAEGTYWYEKI